VIRLACAEHRLSSHTVNDSNTLHQKYLLRTIYQTELLLVSFPIYRSGVKFSLCDVFAVCGVCARDGV
jgi:hypothetical protein